MMEKITQLLLKTKELMTEVNGLKFDDYKDYFEQERFFETAMTDIRVGLRDTEMYLDDISHGLNGDGFCEECGKWYKLLSPIDNEECFLCPECQQKIEEEIWQEQYQDESIPFDEL